MKDALGSELKENDLVALQLERPLIWGRVVKVEEGGIITGISGKGQAQVKSSRIIIESRHVIDVDPRMPAVALLALRDDAEPKPPPPTEMLN
jgi:hypothetical protein